MTKDKTKLKILQPFPVKRGADTILLGICPLCGRRLYLGAANKTGARCRYEGAQFDAAGRFLYDAATPEAERPKRKRPPQKPHGPDTPMHAFKNLPLELRTAWDRSGREGTLRGWLNTRNIWGWTLREVLAAIRSK